MGKQQNGDDRSAGLDDHGSLARSRTAAATEYAGAGGSGIIDERPSHHYDRHHLHGAVGCIADDLQEDQRRMAPAFLVTLRVPIRAPGELTICNFTPEKSCM